MRCPLHPVGDDIVDDGVGGGVGDEVVPEVLDARGIVGGLVAVGEEGVRRAGRGVIAKEDVGPEEPGDVAEAVEWGNGVGKVRDAAAGEDVHGANDAVGNYGAGRANVENFVGAAGRGLDRSFSH